MYCSKCGNKIPDDAKFCAKCGQPFQQSPQTAILAKLQKKTDDTALRVIGIIIVLLILVIVFLIRSKNGGSAMADGSTGEVYENGCLNFEALIQQCEYCETPLNTLVDFCDLGTDYGYDENAINACSIKKYQEMQHNCTADVIQVENVPYVYRCCYGTYSGEWQGAGPSGTGTFVGKTRLREDLVSYTGEWRYGLPEGEGELFVENLHGRDMKYVGQMSAGLRHGTGHMYEYAGGFSGFYRIYDETEFDNDILAVETEAVYYDINTGEMKGYERLIGGEDGDVYLTAEWGAGELNPEEKQALETAASVLLVGALGCMVYSAVSGYQEDKQVMAADAAVRNQEMLAELEKSRAQEQADLMERQEREAEEAEKTRRWNVDKYYEALHNDPDEYFIQTRNYKYNAGLGY